MTSPRTTYRENDARGATPVRLVVLLYEQAIQDLRQAVKAMEEKNIERRTDRINHALEIVGRLQGTLDMDQGGEVARNLLGFYEAVRANLWKAQLYISKEVLFQQINDLLALREAWVEVDRAESSGSAPQAAPPSVSNPTPPTESAYDAGADGRAPANWEA